MESLKAVPPGIPVGVFCNSADPIFFIIFFRKNIIPIMWGELCYLTSPAAIFPAPSLRFFRASPAYVLLLCLGTALIRNLPDISLHFYCINQIELFKKILKVYVGCIWLYRMGVLFRWWWVSPVKVIGTPLVFNWIHTPKNDIKMKNQIIINKTKINPPIAIATSIHSPLKLLEPLSLL